MGFAFNLILKQMKKKKKKNNNRRSRIETSRFHRLPEDLQIDILLRLSSEAVCKSNCVAKPWNELISSLNFRHLFMASKPPVGRLMLYYTLGSHLGEEGIQSYLLSQPEADTTVSDLGNPLPMLRGYFVNGSHHGLLCVKRNGVGFRFEIYNRTTGQQVTTPRLTSRWLTRFGSSRTRHRWDHFGYDHTRGIYQLVSINVLLDEYKRKVKSEYLFLEIGDDSSWRPIEGNTYGHIPFSKGVSIEGVVYYQCRLDRCKFGIMSFSFISHRFNLIEGLPIEATDSPRFAMMNFNNKPAVVDSYMIDSEGKIDLFVLEGEKNWVKKTISLPMSLLKLHLEFSDDIDEILLIPMQWKNEVRFSINPVLGRTKSYVIFDLEEYKIKRIVQLGPLPPHLSRIPPNHVDFLEDGVVNIVHLKT